MKANGSITWDETEAGQNLQERLNNEKTLRALDHLLARIDTLETAVDRLATLMEQGPGMISMAADTVDETARRAADNGIYLEERLSNALHLAERLTAPETVEKINALLTLAEQAPGMISMMADAVDEEIRHACDRGVNIDKRLGTALRLAERITDPQMEERLNTLLDLSDQMPGMLAMTMDILDEGYRKAADAGLDLQTLFNQGAFALKQMVALLSSEEFKALMASGVLSPQTLNVVAQAGEALTESQQAEHKKAGLFATMRALSDPDRKRAMGFVLTFMKNFGKKL